MKSDAKSKIIILIALGIIFALLPIITVNHSFIPGNSNTSSKYSDNTNSDKENLKISAVTGPIYIDDNNPSSNWSVAKDTGICTGNGTFSEPYVIEDFIIDSGGSGTGIMILNSDVYFRIENCTVYNSGTGIRLTEVTNSQLINNDCSFNYQGIILYYSNNNSIEGNIVNISFWTGIAIIYSENNTVSGNIANNNEDGIWLLYSNNHTLSGNIANNNTDRGIIVSGVDHIVSGNIANNNTNRGIFIGGDSNIVSGNNASNNQFGIAIYGNDHIISGNNINNNQFGIAIFDEDNVVTGNLMNNCGLTTTSSNNIDTTNLVNGKPLYYYKNEVNLEPDDFLDAGQVILVNCNDSLVQNLNVSCGTLGITLSNCNNNNISGNTANNNKDDGIYLINSNNNILSGNTASYNGDDGIHLKSNSQFNDILGNNANNNSDVGIFLSSSDFNIVSGNTLIGNTECIIEENCVGNIFSDNGDCTYGQGDGGLSPLISGYNLFFLLGILSVVAIFISKKLKKS